MNVMNARAPEFTDCLGSEMNKTFCETWIDKIEDTELEGERMLLNRTEKFPEDCIETGVVVTENTVNSAVDDLRETGKEPENPSIDAES